MKTVILMFVITSVTAFGVFAENGGNKKMSIYDYNLRDIDGRDVTLKDFQGKVVMLVNVASKCGFTPQYEGLEALYKQYKDRGFVILGIPSNNFLGQEPGSDEQIKEFCTLTYGVSFPMFSKISVKGRDIHPLYKYLTDKKTNPQFGGNITWNFNKFLVNREGEIIARFASKDEPLKDSVIKAIEDAL